MRRTSFAVVLSLAVLAGACQGGAPGPAATTAATPAPQTTAPAAGLASAPPGHAAADLTATVVQYTRDRPARVVQVKIANTSDETVDVTMLEPRLAGYPAAEAPDQTSHLGPGMRRDFPVPLGAASCDGDVPDGSEVVLQVTGADGVAVRHTVPIDDGPGLLPRVHTLDCDVARVEDTVDISVGDTWQRVGRGADAAVVGHVTMALRDGAAAEVRVADLEAGLLLGVTSGVPDPDSRDATYAVDPARPRTEWDVELVGTRCDGHAVAEARRLMAFTFYVSIDGGEPVPVRRPIGDDGFNVLIEALLERCEARGTPV